MCFITLNDFIDYVPHLKGGGRIGFGVDPIGISVRVASVPFLIF